MGGFCRAWSVGGSGGGRLSEREACLIRPPGALKRKTLAGGARAWRVTSREDHGWNVDAWLTVFRPGETHEWHAHEEDELIYVVEGEGRYELEDRSIEFRAGDCVFLPRKTRHRSMTGGEKDVRLLAIFHPARE